ncbi:MAG TPA: LysE family translocator [Solirubrobacteraceae bacterium]|jgi:threonine/homoserine/homoserine lactone efflux protein|nr:LysE family translocator [Solirubrobacteraceae bacterium]
MLPTDHFLTFFLTVAVLIMIPGPSVLFVVGRGVALGRRAALLTVAGNSCGLAVQLIAVALGVGAIVARSDAVFTTLKLLGGLYLVFLGVRNIRDRKALGTLVSSQVEPQRLRRLVREGFIVGATNPKGVLIFTAILPQFIERSRGGVQVQLLLLGAIAVAMGLISDGVWAIAAGSARAWLGRSQGRLEQLSTAGGLTLIGLGAALALTGRKQ